MEGQDSLLLQGVTMPWDSGIAPAYPRYLNSILVYPVILPWYSPFWEQHNRRSVRPQRHSELGRSLNGEVEGAGEKPPFSEGSRHLKTAHNSLVSKRNAQRQKVTIIKILKIK